MYNWENCTVLFTYWNTPKDVFLGSLGSAAKLDLDILIVDDCSSEEYKLVLQECIDEVKKSTTRNIQSITPDKKMQQEGCTFYGAERIKTEYVIRIDSDDIISAIPQLPSGVEVADIVTSNKKIARSLNDWLIGGAPNINGCVIRRSVLLNCYSDYEYLSKHHHYFHEDVYTNIWMFLTDTPIIAYGGEKTYKAVINGESKFKFTLGFNIKRLETLHAVCLRLNIPPEVYYKYSKIVYNSEPKRPLRLRKSPFRFL